MTARQPVVVQCCNLQPYVSACQCQPAAITVTKLQYLVVITEQ